MSGDITTSPGQLRQFEENQGWLPRQSETPTTSSTGTPGMETPPAQQEVKPTMGWLAQKASFNKGEYFDHDRKIYHRDKDGRREQT